MTGRRRSKEPNRTSRRSRVRDTTLAVQNQARTKATRAVSSNWITSNSILRKPRSLSTQQTKPIFLISQPSQQFAFVSLRKVRQTPQLESTASQQHLHRLSLHRKQRLTLMSMILPKLSRLNKPQPRTSRFAQSGCPFYHPPCTTNSTAHCPKHQHRNSTTVTSRESTRLIHPTRPLTSTSSLLALLNRSSTNSDLLLRPLQRKSTNSNAKV